MAHYAQISNNIVVQVLVLDNDNPDPMGWLTSNLGGEWVQTSYNTFGGVHYGPDGQPDGGTQLRYNYAGIGYNYDPTADAFYAPQPDPTYTLDTTTYLWVVNPPTP